MFEKSFAMDEDWVVIESKKDIKTSLIPKDKNATLDGNDLTLNTKKPFKEGSIACALTETKKERCLLKKNKKPILLSKFIFFAYGSAIKTPLSFFYTVNKHYPSLNTDSEWNILHKE